MQISFELFSARPQRPLLWGGVKKVLEITPRTCVKALLTTQSFLKVKVWFRGGGGSYGTK